jgi:hypothetical protein
VEEEAFSQAQAQAPKDESSFQCVFSFSCELCLQCSIIIPTLQNKRTAVPLGGTAANSADPSIWPEAATRAMITNPSLLLTSSGRYSLRIAQPKGILLPEFRGACTCLNSHDHRRGTVDCQIVQSVAKNVFLNAIGSMHAV